MELSYVETEGILYPEIQVAENQSEINLGKYGRMALKYLKENHQSRYSLLLMEENLMDIMKQVNEEAYNKLDMLVDQMLKEDPIDNYRDTMETNKKKIQKQMIAEEIVLKEIVFQVR